MPQASTAPSSFFSLSTLLLVSALGVIGCATGTPRTISAIAAPQVRSFQGSIHGGQQPVSGASIQLYAVNSGGDYGRGSTPLIMGTLPQSDVNGAFNITGLYTPPSTPSHFYIVASGGSPSAGMPNNPASLLMATIGGCNPTVGLSPSLFINVNEITTMASTLALQPFMAAPSAANAGAPSVGAPSANDVDLRNAFQMSNNLASIATGAAVLPADNWATTSQNALRLNTLGDILASCINSSGSVPCSNLFTIAEPPSATYTAVDTVQAGWYIAQNPTFNVTNLFNLVPPSPPFIGLTSPPADFSVTVANAASSCQSAVSLATAANFAVLGASTVTNVGSTTITGGDLGVYPTNSITGFPPGILTPPAAMHGADGTAAQAQTDLGQAYTALSTLSGAAALPADISGLTLPPGLYKTASTAQISTNLTLDAQGDPSAVFLFEIGTTLTTAADTNVILINGASAKNIFWQVGTAATLGAGSAFEGTIMASTAITFNPGVSLTGRALVETGAVTLNNNTITAP
jgi:hypothetical protein